MKTMKIMLAAALVAGTVGISVPASAQRLTIGPDGPGIDLRSRRDRVRDRRDAREDRNYRQQRYESRDRGNRRGYDY